LLSLDIKPTVNDRLVDHPFGPSQLTDVGLIAERPSQRAIEASKCTLATAVKTSIELMAFTSQRAIEASKRPLATAVKASIELMAFVIIELTVFVILLAAFGFLVVVLFCVAEAGVWS